MKQEDMNKHFSFSAIVMMVCGLLILSACNAGVSAPEPTAVPQPTAEPVIPVTGPEEIQHKSIPAELPAEDSLAFGDQDTSDYADKKVAPDGDRFLKDLFERPFNANTMDTYYPDLDIQQVSIYEDGEWYYGVIQMKGADESGAFPGTYGLELDLNLDGRGDLLTLASAPVAGEWSSTGVQVYKDSNGDVGNKQILASDPPQTGDGYDLLVADDPDAAFSRLVGENIIQIAFKKSLLAGDDGFMVAAWAGMENLNPAWFDLDDHFTHDEAGAADPGFPLYYPIKALEKIDNTCRMPVGRAASGPGLCPSYIPKDAPPPAPGAPPPPPPQQPPPPA